MDDRIWIDDGDGPEELRDWEVCDHGLYFEDPCEDCDEDEIEEGEK